MKASDDLTSAIALISARKQSMEEDSHEATMEYIHHLRSINAETDRLILTSALATLSCGLLEIINMSGVLAEDITTDRMLQELALGVALFNEENGL